MRSLAFIKNSIAARRLYALVYAGSSLSALLQSSRAGPKSISFVRAVARFVSAATLVGSRLMASVYSSTARGKSPALNASLPRSRASEVER